jgi:hypothetical protein
MIASAIHRISPAVSVKTPSAHAERRAIARERRWNLHRVVRQGCDGAPGFNVTDWDLEAAAPAAVSCSSGRRRAPSTRIASTALAGVRPRIFE